MISHTFSCNIKITYVTQNVKEYLDAKAEVHLDTVKYLVLSLCVHNFYGIAFESSLLKQKCATYIILC